MLRYFFTVSFHNSKHVSFKDSYFWKENVPGWQKCYQFFWLALERRPQLFNKINKLWAFSFLFAQCSPLPLHQQKDKEDMTHDVHTSAYNSNLWVRTVEGSSITDIISDLKIFPYIFQFIYKSLYLFITNLHPSWACIFQKHEVTTCSLLNWHISRKYQGLRMLTSEL